MKYWYRIDMTDAGQKDGLCRHLRRQRLEHKTSRLPGGFKVAMYLSEEELAEVQKWLEEH